jgi:hypothetical protein
MLKTTNMLRPVSRTSKAKDLLERLDTMANWWMQVPPAEQRRRETMSRREEMTPPEQHASIERIYAAHRATAQQFWAPTSSFFPLFYVCAKLFSHRTIQFRDG